jgi:agmatine/peptidylarginine deiminase
MNNDSGDCLMTDKVLEVNAEEQVEGDLILDKDAIVSYFKDFAGCKNVLILPSMPYEGTQHLDLWAKFVDDRTILVSQIADEVLDLPAYSPEDRVRAREVQSFLESRAAELQSRGFRIIRLPMPAPNFAADGYNLFRSYTNSLLLNGHVFLPRYVRPANEADSVNGEYIDLPYVPAYEDSVERIHRELGFTVHWIPSDSMIAKGGAVHCTTMQIAR